MVTLGVCCSVLQILTMCQIHFIWMKTMSEENIFLLKLYLFAKGSELFMYRVQLNSQSFVAQFKQEKICIFSLKAKMNDYLKVKWTCPNLLALKPQIETFFLCEGIYILQVILFLHPLCVQGLKRNVEDSKENKRVSNEKSSCLNASEH